MDLHQLRVFRSAALHRSFTRAGEELRLSQSTVSLHIKELEEKLGSLLFLRAGRKVIPTPAGALLLEYAERILREIKNAEMAVRETSGGQRGTVRLGAGATTLMYRLPRCLSAYRRRFPGVEVIIETGTTEHLAQRLLAQRLDLAVVMLPLAVHGLRITPIASDELVVVLPNNHPAARKPALAPEDLAGLSFILYEKRTVMQDVIDAWFASLGVAPRVTMELENIEAIKSLVRSGFGASVLPYCAVARAARGEKLRPLRVRDRPLHRRLALANLDAEAFPGPIEALARMISSGLATP